MSKFFRGAVSSSSESESDVSDVEVPVAQARPLGRQDFAYPSESDDEGPKRVVRTQKDKTYGDLKEMIRNSRNARNIKDFSKLLSIFEDHIKAWEKARAVIARESLSTPRFYIRYLLEDCVNEQWEDKEARKIMSKQNSKALSTLRQKLKKYSKDFEDQLTTYREGPDPLGYSSGAAEDNEDDDEVPRVEPTAAAPIVKKRVSADKPAAAKKKFMGAESASEGSQSEDESEWGSESEESSSASDLEPLEGKEMEELRRYFLKKDKTVKKPKDREKAKEKQKAKEKARALADQDEGGEDKENEEAWKKITYKHDVAKPLFDKKDEVTGELVAKKLSELNANRGRKSTNRKVYLRYLQELYKVTDEHGIGVGMLAKILISVISALFELNVRISDAMEFNSWVKTVEAVDGLLSLLAEHPDVIISISTYEDEENLLDPSKGPYRIHGSVILMVKRLDDELTKIFQTTDCHSTEYIGKLRGESLICGLIEKAKQYVDIRRKQEGAIDEDELLTVYALRIEHLYYKYSLNEAETEQEMDTLCKAIYATDKGLNRQRAMLCQIYHHALHNRWQKARNLVLMSHLQALVDHSDAGTQVLYNRTICQLGLCAFRHGLIREAHQILSEIQNAQRAKELLAQGIPPRQAEKTAEQELKERSVQVPYHMHINLELMECVYLISSMLLEIPNVACYEYDVRRRLLSRSFHYQLKLSEKSALIGPPENTREHVVAASRAMLRGDWTRCRDYVINDKMNAKVWNLFRNSDGIKQMLVSRIQEETMRTYLLMYSTIYQTVSLTQLCEQFELTRQRIYSIISKMILHEELCAKFDESTDCLIMHKVEPSKLQLLSLQAAEKFSQVSVLEQGGAQMAGGGGMAQDHHRRSGAGGQGGQGQGEQEGGGGEKAWVPLEHNPEAFNSYFQDLGIKGVDCRDLCVLTPELGFHFEPGPHYALIYCYPCSEKAGTYIKQRYASAEDKTVPKGVFFMRQHIHKACGTFSLLHSLANNTQHFEIENGPFFRWFEKAKRLDVQTRSDCLFYDKAMELAHYRCAERGDTAVPEADSIVDHHSIAYLHNNGRLLEFDSSQDFPRDCGPTSDENLFYDAGAECMNLARAAGDPLCSAIILVEKPKDEQLTQTM